MKSTGVDDAGHENTPVNSKGNAQMLGGIAIRPLLCYGTVAPPARPSFRQDVCEVLTGLEVCPNSFLIAQNHCLDEAII